MHKKVLSKIPLNLNLFNIKYLLKPLRATETKLQNLILFKSRIIKEKKIPKKNKMEFRILNYPVGEYKIILKHLNKYLKSHARFSDNICGGVIDKSLFNMVKDHCGKEAIFQIDLENFFPNISSNRIFTFFKNTGCSDKISQVLTDLVTFNDRLPQGFATSPIVSNLIAWKMDFDIQMICEKHNLSYTRWIDDIIVSGRLSELIKAIYKIENSILKNGFIINKSKRKFSKRIVSSEIIAVGLDIKKHKPNIPKSVYEKLENILIMMVTDGVHKAVEFYEEEFKSKNIQQSVMGKIRFVQTYNKKEAEKFIEIYEKINWSLN